eukprot:g3696.t1
MAAGQTCKEGEVCQVLNEAEQMHWQDVLGSEYDYVKSEQCPPRWHCPDGSILSEGARACEPGEIWDGRSRCSRCERSDQFAVTRATFAWLAPASALRQNETCVQCPQILNDEADCKGGMLRFQNGFWHSGLEWHDAETQTMLVHRTLGSYMNESFTFFPCPCPDCCEVDSVNGSVTCATGSMGSLFQVSTATSMAMLYIPLLARVRPYERPSDNYLALSANTGLFFVLLTSLLMKVKDDFVSTGRFEAGYSEDTLGIFLIVVTVMTVAFAVAGFCNDIREFNTRQSFRHADGTLLTLPRLKAGHRQPKHYHVFMSHSQQDGGDQVQHMKKELEKYVGTINIFTDVAAGQHERALEEKSQLYDVIEKSDVFLVFLTRTYFTRKWCVKEFQEAIARPDVHVVLVLDHDARHGGMQLKEFVEYSTTQKSRREEDRRVRRASNLWNQEGCEELGQWVADHIAVDPDTPDHIKIKEHVYNSEQIKTQSYRVVPWFRFAEEKKVTLQLAVEEMLRTTKRWGHEQRWQLQLPVTRPVLPQTTYHKPYHLFLSEHYDRAAAMAIEEKLRACTNDRIVLKQKARDARKCQAMLVVISASANPGRVPWSQFTSDKKYQNDLRRGLEHQLPVVLVLDVTTNLDAMTGPLWEVAKREQQPLLGADHLRTLLNPIAPRKQRTFTGSEGDDMANPMHDIEAGVPAPRHNPMHAAAMPEPVAEPVSEPVPAPMPEPVAAPDNTVRGLLHKKGHQRGVVSDSWKARFFVFDRNTRLLKYGADEAAALTRPLGQCTVNGVAEDVKDRDGKRQNRFDLDCHSAAKGAYCLQVSAPSFAEKQRWMGALAGTGGSASEAGAPASRLQMQRSSQEQQSTTL